MGYTHYWHSMPFYDLSKDPQFIIDTRHLLAYGESRKKIEIAQCDEFGILFNGIGEEAHEDLYFYEKPKSDFEFCKTARI